MTFSRRVFAGFGALALMAALTTGSYAQDKNQEQAQTTRKLNNDERREYIALVSLVDAVAAGKQPAPADLKLKFQHHHLKSNDGIYLPYTLDISGGTFSSFPVTMYVRAVPTASAASAAPASTPKGSEKGSDKPADWPFEDIYFLNEKSLAPVGDVATVSRALSLPSGEYTVYVAMREKQPKDKKQGPPKTVVLSQPLSVPDMESGLTTSSIILSKTLDPAPEQLTGLQQLEQPFTISGYKLTPTFSANIPQSEELLFVFVIYNEGAGASGKPDLVVEYNFFRAAEEKPFTRLANQPFNVTTLPGEFDLKLGHQVFVGQGIPLKSSAMTFAPGDYRMEIKITDKINSQTITRNVPFTVS